MRKNVIKYAIIIIGLAFVIYYLMLKHIMGPITFSKYLFYGGIVLIIIPFIDKLLNKLLDKYKSYKLFRKVIIAFVLVFTVIFGVTEIFIVSCSLQKNYDDVDYTIVLGAGLRGENMTLTLKQRVDTSLEYIDKSNNFGYIVMSGGQGAGESIPESYAMKKYVVQNGVSDEKVLTEDKSTSTYENILFSIGLIEKHSNEDIENLNIKVITSGFHSLRAKFICNKLGIKNLTVLSAPINPIFIPTYYIREFLAFYHTLFSL